MRAPAPILAVTASLAFLFDQASKWIMLLGVMETPRTVEVLPFFNLVLTYNRGVSFGILASDLWWKPYFLIAVALSVVGGLLWWVRGQEARLPRLGVGLIVGGAFGNILDRLIHPGVVDFLDFHAAGYHWPAFNVADSCIFIGVALLLWDGLFEGGNKGKTEG